LQVGLASIRRNGTVFDRLMHRYVHCHASHGALVRIATVSDGGICQTAQHRIRISAEISSNIFIAP
jgi:hypothetical protein